MRRPLFLVIFAILALAILLPGCGQTGDVCDRLPAGASRDDCYSQAAKSQNDYSVCDKIANEGKRYQCRTGHEPPVNEPIPEPVVVEPAANATPPAPAGPRVANVSTSELEQELFYLVNQERLQAGLAPVTLASDASAASRAQSERDAQSQPRLPSDQIQAAYERAGAPTIALAELDASSYDSETPGQAAIAYWRADPPSFAQIISPEYTEAGIGIALSQNQTYHLTLALFTRATCGYAGGPCCPDASDPTGCVCNAGLSRGPEQTCVKGG